jgi:hypothetical protein
MNKYSPLQGWLDRTDSLTSFIDLECRPPSYEYGGFLSLDVVLPVHGSVNLAAESLSTSWTRTHEYVRESLAIIDAEEPLWLDREEVQMIKSKLGEPPPLSYPIYILSVSDDKSERAVYIGKTSSEKGRFRGGHAAITKLHNPKYDGLTKRLYLGGIVLLADDKEYQPLEWVKPLAKAMEILNSIEKQLIYRFQPELNTKHKKHYNVKVPVSIHIQNSSGETEFLHDQFVWI